MTIGVRNKQASRSPPTTTGTEPTNGPGGPKKHQGSELPSKAKREAADIFLVVDHSAWKQTWCETLFRGADAVARRRKKHRLIARDGKTSVAELRRYIDRPTPIQVTRLQNGVPAPGKVTLLSSERFHELVAALDQAGGRPERLPKSPPWMQPTARALLSDLQHPWGTPITREALLEYARGYYRGEGKEDGQVMLVTNQRLSQVYHRVAEHTGEMDSLDIVDQLSEYQLQFSAMAVQWDEDTRSFNSVRTTLFEADLALQSSLRPEGFKPYFQELGPSVRTYQGHYRLKKLEGTSPQGYPRMQVVDAQGKPVQYKKKPLEVSGPTYREGRSYFLLQKADGSAVLDPAGRPQLATFDKGHAQANQQFTQLADMEESFAMENMHAQVPTSNSVVWLNGVEEAVRGELKARPGSRAVDVTGVLFATSKPVAGAQVQPWALDTRQEDPASFRTLPEEQWTWVDGTSAVAGKEKGVPVPTHSYKAVLFQIPGKPNTYYCKCYLVRNDMNLDPKSKPLEISLRQLEKILQDSGQPQLFFEDLPPDVREQLYDGDSARWEESFVREGGMEDVRAGEMT